MQVRKTEFHRFANGETVFVIPVYQRNYDWKVENCRQLFYDICNDMLNRARTQDGEMKGHFIGTICFKVEGKYNHVIIDGQQRLTTLMLLLKAIYDTTTNKRLKRKIKTKFLVNEFAQDEVKIKLKPIKRDEYTYNKLISSEVVNIDEFDPASARSTVLRNYKYLKSLVEQELDEDSFEPFVESLEQLEIVELSLDHENPQVIFESFNSTGLPLTNTDLLRNYILMPMEYNIQEKMYNSYWAKIEELLGSENMEMFMTHYMLLKMKTNSFSDCGQAEQLSSKTLYSCFKHYFPDLNRAQADKIEEVFKELLKYAQYYKMFIFSNGDSEPTSAPHSQLYELFYCLNQQDAAPQVMYLTEHLQSGLINMQTYIKILTMMISFATRSVVCRRTGFVKQRVSMLQKIDEELKTNAQLKSELENEQDDEYVAMWWKVFTSGKGTFSFPKDNEFRTALETTDLYESLKSKRCKYLLLKIESYKNPKERLSFGNGSVEHVMPRTLSQTWKDYLNLKLDLMNHDSFVDTLGNLTLTGYNSELGNTAFVEKCENYETSNYLITREITKYSDWTSKSISARAKELAEIALKIWPLPTEYNKACSVDTGVTYTLKTDPNSFVGTKPETISVFGEETQGANWSDLVWNVCKGLYEKDGKLLLDLLQTKKFPGKKQYLYTERPSSVRVGLISENPRYYVMSCDHVEDNLVFLKSLLEHFDEESDTNLVDNVWFTLKST